MILKHIQKQLHTCNILLLCHPGHRLRPATQSGTAVSAGAAPTAAGSAPGRRGAAAAGTAHPGPSAPATERRGPPPVARRQWAGGSGRPGPFVPALRQERCPMPQLPRLGQQCSGGGGGPNHKTTKTKTTAWPSSCIGEDEALSSVLCGPPRNVGLGHSAGWFETHPGVGEVHTYPGGVHKQKWAL